MWVKRVLDVADDIFFVTYQVSLKFLNDTLVFLKWIFVIAQFLDVQTLAGLVKSTLVAGCEDVKTSLVSDGMAVDGGVDGGCIIGNISLWHTK